MSNKQESKRILALVSDLLFTVKITDAAKRNGMQVDYVKTEEDFFNHLKTAPPALVILDLNIPSAEPVKLIQKLKKDENLKSIHVLSYVSHVQGDLKVKAQEAGSDLVMARSAFSQNLQQILKRHAS
ncbi:MAG: response regulator [Bryobacteraceae bacterium]|nr:response regulator [Bryobacteraceae bacterium]MDW8377240.1 response regulator [Bryobacterales bacterium]